MSTDRFALPSLEALLDHPPQTVTRTGGAPLTYSRFGAPDGRRVMWLHGSPSCRLEGLVFHDWAVENGVSIVAFDRPGLGDAPPRPGLTVRDIADDAVALADALGWDRFHVFGGSAGGPYTLAVAAAIPQRLDAVVILASGGVDPANPAASGWVDRAASVLSRRTPAILTAYFSMIQLGMRLPGPLITGVARWIPSPDAAPLRHPRFVALFKAVNAAAFRQGTAGAIEDYRRLGSDWGFSVGDIRAPVTVIQGTKDASVPIRQAQHYAKTIPDAALHLAPGDGHFAAIFNWQRVATILGWA
ncbi:MAG: alpha/beta hydrolase [Myxococcota bacterium]